MIRTTVRLPKKLNDLMKRESYKTGVSQNNIFLEMVENRYKEELKMTKYYLQINEFPIRNQEGRTIEEGNILQLEEEDITKKIDLAGMAYTTDIDSIEEYDIFDPDSTESIEISEKEDYIFVRADDLTYAEQEYIINQGLGVSIEDMLIEEHGEISKEKMIEILMQSLKDKFTNEQWEPNEYLAYDYWNGSEREEIILEHEEYDSSYQDYTDELEGMKEIDKYKGDTYIERLYETKDGEKLLITTSFYEGALPTYKWIDSGIGSIDEIE